MSLVFSYLPKVLFSGFVQFKGNFVDGQNNSKYLDLVPLTFSALRGILESFQVLEEAG